MEASTRLDIALKNASIPIIGVTQFADGTLSIDYEPSATAQQRVQGQALLTGLDKRKRRQRTIAAIAQDIAALSAANQQKLSFAIQAYILQTNPDFARKLTLPFDGDEPDV